MADLALKSFASEKLDATCRQAILGAASQSADVNERALTDRDLTLKAVNVVGRSARALQLDLTYVAERNGFKTTAEIPVTLIGSLLEGARVAMEKVVERAPFGEAALKSKPLWMNPELEAKLAAAVGATPETIVCVTMDTGDRYIGQRIDAAFTPFDGHPSDGVTEAKKGAIYVTTNDIAFLAGRETAYVLEDKNGKLTVTSEDVLAQS